MKPILILFATREGQSAHIADRVATQVQSQGIEADLWNADLVPPEFDLNGYCAAILVASAHQGRHEAEMRRFVRRYANDLNRMPSAFLSVSLAQAGAEDSSAPAERRARGATDANRMIHAFLNESRWHPSRVKAVAGALRYSRYNVLLRFVMKRIARQMGAPTDASKDYEYTDWNALDAFVVECLQSWAFAKPPVSAVR